MSSNRKNTKYMMIKNIRHTTVHPLCAMGWLMVLLTSQTLNKYKLPNTDLSNLLSATEVINYAQVAQTQISLGLDDDYMF